MISELKNEAKKQIQGIQFSLFIPLFIISLFGSILSYTIIGAILMFSFGYISDIFIYKFVTTGHRSFATAYEDFTTNIDNLVVMIWAGLRMFLYNGIMLVVGTIISILCMMAGNVALIILGVIVLIAVAVGSAVLQFMFYFVPYILKDSDYKIAPRDAFTLSNRMTDGKKMTLLWLNLSFIGHYLLVALTLGIYSIWLTPYVMTTKALFYEQTKKEYLSTHNDILTSYIDNIKVNDDDDTPNNGTDFDSVEQMFSNESAHNVDPFSEADAPGTDASNKPNDGDAPNVGGESFPEGFDPFK